MSAPLVGVLGLQGDVAEHVHCLDRVGARPRRVRRAHELQGLSGMVLPGGESTTVGRLLEVFGLLEPLRGAVADGLPVLGTCAGMVLLARDVVDGRRGQPLLRALDVSVRRNAFGGQVDSFEVDLEAPSLVGDGPPLRGVFIRSPRVERVGEDVEVLARLPAPPGGDPFAGAAQGDPALGDPTDVEGRAGSVVAVRRGSLVATAFHPEVAGDDRVHEEFVRMCR